jgi:hypothetical protein
MRHFGNIYRSGVVHYYLDSFLVNDVLIDMSAFKRRFEKRNNESGTFMSTNSGK